MKKKEKYYGIYLNDDIPKIDKINKYSKEIEIKFEGKAYLIERDDEDKIIERTEIENEYKLKKEKDYEIEFTNINNEIFYLQVRIETSYLFLLLLLFIFGVVLGLLFSRPLKDGKSVFDRFYDYIDLAIIQLDIDEDKARIEVEEKPKIYYDFDGMFKNISSDEINLADSISAKSLVRNKIAPGVQGSFSIIISTKKSTVDMKYAIQFQDVTDEKPSNMVFKIQGSDTAYFTLQDLEKELSGIINKKSEKEITIDWKWGYEVGDDETTMIQNDKTDTNDGKNLQSYRFKIIVTGEEAI